MTPAELNFEYLFSLQQQVQLLNEEIKKLTEQIDTIKKSKPKDWMNFKEACDYIGVAHNTFTKYRSLGLKTCAVEGVKRVSKKDIDEFLNKYIN